ncbi:MAG: hypothetical protein M5U34_46840 [Chloroflexi bacterium]|nr:hypothetical protein [Chloroflexota bacterium]
MFDWFRKQFRRTEIRTMQLSFALDREGDQHLVQVYKQKDGATVPITDITPLWQYGYQETTETEDGEIVYILDEKDRQTLLSLRSLNPKKGGTAVYPSALPPPMLNYLRTKENIRETGSSEKLQVRDKPLAAAAQIDFNPQAGLTVTTGYHDPVTQEMLPAEAFHKTAVGDYVMIGDTFMPLPPPPSDTVKNG